MMGICMCVTKATIEFKFFREHQSINQHSHIQFLMQIKTFDHCKNLS